MWSLVILCCLTITWVGAQNGRGPQHQDHNGHGWDIRLAVPGEPGNDYPTLGSIPKTSFSCAGKEPGYYADLEANCQVFRVCTLGSTYGFQSFLCPNGTLFNQAVFVCDWWMNVDCKNSERLFNNNNEKFGNLRLGPQLMKDVKKMLTHPMLNPYNQSVMKSNQIVMQDYKPPFGQLFPNGALIAGPERSPNNVYVPSKLVQQGFPQGNPNDIAFSASTPNPSYIPALTNFLPNERDSETFQRQRQNNQYVQNSKNYRTQASSNLISNSHTGKFIQNTNAGFTDNDYSQVARPIQPGNSQQFDQRQLNRKRNQFESKRIPQAKKNEKQTDFGVSFTNANTNSDSQAYTYNAPQFSNNLEHPVSKELKQNLVSNILEVPSTVITRTVSYSRVVNRPKVSKPKSRITFKTWILKPRKSAKLKAEPTPYTYPKPSPPPSPTPTEKLVEINTPYVYETPTPATEIEKILSTEPESGEAYVYNKPTPAAKQIDTTRIETTRIYVAPTTVPTRPTFPSSARPSRLYLTPAPFTSTARLYLPPRLYLPSNIIQQSNYYQSSQLRASPTVPSTTLVSFNKIPNESYRNLTFTDILTKEKLDSTVHGIVKDTGSILRTASPPQYDQYHTDLKITKYSNNDNLLTTSATADSGENLTPQSPTHSVTTDAKSERIISMPARSLQPPTEHYVNQNTNRLSTLPFYKESSLPNTIERTVSIKITIPERIASYLFSNRSNEPDYDKLEILNTGSSNYLVLSNNIAAKKNNYNFIPLAKLIENKNTNVSDSQALVYSFLTDSINMAREYNNIVKQGLSSQATPTSAQATPTSAQFQNINNEQLSQITNKISQLTSSQYSNAYNTALSSQNSQLQSSQYIPPSQQIQGNVFSSRLQAPNRIQQNAFNVPNQVYSGQLYKLPVPEVTNQIYNNQNSANLVNPHIHMFDVHETRQKNKQLRDSDFEIVKAETVPLYNKQNLQSTNETESGTSQESFSHLFNSENGISAKLQDKIVGTLPHPLEDNKLLSYKNDQSYYVFTKLEENSIDHDTSTKEDSGKTSQQSAKLQSMETPQLDYQFIPSVSFELQDDKEQQDILNAFHIDEFGAPRDVTTSKETDKTKHQTSNVDFEVEHPRQSVESISSIYSGPSSYTAPQSSVGSLRNKEATNNLSSRLEDLDGTDESGYPKERPARQYNF